MQKYGLLLALVATLALAAGSALAAPCLQDPGLGYTVGGDCLLAPDADGDGIPNGQDPDYTPPADGTGSKFGKSMAMPAVSLQFRVSEWLRFMWLGGIGTCVSGVLSDGYGPGDGTGNGGDGPGDCTGYGPGDGTGDCDGAGLKARLRAGK